MPADADLIEAAALLVDESSLTGESVAVDKALRLWTAPIVISPPGRSWFGAGRAR